MPRLFLAFAFRRGILITALTLTVAAMAEEKPAKEAASAEVVWPPEVPGHKNGTVTLASQEFLSIPDEVKATQSDEGVAKFVMAKEPPTVDLAFHDELGPNAATRRLWSSWGDICLAKEGKVYVGIGDHGQDAQGDARCFLYCWDPKAKSLSQIVDMNEVVPKREGQPAWSKVHAKIDEGPGGKIVFSCTLNDGNRAKTPQYKWNAQLPGGQLYQYDPQTGETSVFASLPPKRCSATSLYDAKRGTWWCNLEAGEGNALFGLNLKTSETIYLGKDGEVGFNRSFALGEKGEIYFNGEAGKLMTLDPASQMISDTGNVFPDSPGMRASSRVSRKGEIFGTTHKTNQLFRYNTRTEELDLLGPTWGLGQYTTVTELSPDERFLYYLPGSHGQAFKYGTPVVQYEIATGTRKVLAFLAPVFEKQLHYVPGGTYGVKLSADGGTLYVNFNGHAADAIRPPHMKPNGFGLCSFAAIHIPASER